MNYRYKTRKNGYGKKMLVENASRVDFYSI